MAEITHEVLFENWKTLNTWIDEDRDDIRLKRRLSDQAYRWNDKGRESGYLWRSPDLDLLKDYHKRCASDMTQLEIEFHRASVRKKQLSRTFKYGMVFLLILSTLFSGYFYWKVNIEKTNNEKQLYYSNIILAQNYIKKGKYDLARKVLWETPENQRHWEWSFLIDKTQQFLYSLGDKNYHVTSARFSPDGKFILTGSSRGIAKLWNADTGEKIREFKCHNDYIWNVEFSPDGKRFLTASQDNTVKIWDVNAEKPLHTLYGYKDQEYYQQQVFHFSFPFQLRFNIFEK